MVNEDKKKKEEGGPPSEIKLGVKRAASEQPVQQQLPEESNKK
jgi:hypothetical protein